MLQVKTYYETKENSVPQDQALPEHSADIRIGRELLKATKPFAVESIRESWWHVGSTFVLMIAVLIGAGVAPWWPVRLFFSLLGGLLMVRGFITYHDYMHGAILRDSRVAWLLFRLYAAFALTPPRSWKKSHNYHHGHVGKISSASVGAFPHDDHSDVAKSVTFTTLQLPLSKTSIGGNFWIYHDFPDQHYALTPVT